MYQLVFSMKYVVYGAMVCFFLYTIYYILPTISPVHAQAEALVASSSATQTATPTATLKPTQTDITKPEQNTTSEVLALFAKRTADHPNFVNIVAFAIQSSIKAGVPANTVILILLLPFLATLVAFIRHIIGLPSLEMLVPIALSITLLATGVTAGIILIISIILASTLARFILKKVRIMQLPKMALSIFVVSIFIFMSLTASAQAGILEVKSLSIFPVLLLILLSERIVSLQLERSLGETVFITSVTFGLGLIGFILLSSTVLRNFVLLYPEVVLSLIPVNIIIGRYFGLRLTEYFRFRVINKYAGK